MKKWNLLLAAMLLATSAFAATDRVLDGKTLTVGSAVLTLPTATGTLLSEINSISVTGKTFSGASNTFSAIPVGAIGNGSVLSGTNTGDVSRGAFGSTPNAFGFSLSGQALSLEPADATHPGGLSSADWSTFNGKQAALGFTPENVANKGAASGYASLDANGTVPVNQIPPAALERLVVVATQVARYALTTATVQNGDTVKQTDTGEMWYVTDDTNLGNSSGYAVYTAGTASTVAWGGITGIPSPVSSLSGTNTGDVTIGTGNGLSLASQALSLAAATSSVTGALTATDWTTFNGKLTSPLTTLGDIMYENATPVAARLAGNTTTTKQFLSQTGNGSISAAPAWASLAAADLAVAVTPGSSGNVLTSNGSTWTSSAPASVAPVITGSRGTPSAIVAGTGVAFTGSSYGNIWFIQGSGGAVTVSANPQVVAGSSIGQTLSLIGRSATNTVTLADGTGLSLNGTWVGGLDSVLNLLWDGSAWVEMSRR